LRDDMLHLRAPASPSQYGYGRDYRKARDRSPPVT
jgi:hypothetical protein